tara:strand:+ start:66 stop:260 length:195 start_codon:yes stop_codon:yes gene_type:complete
MNIEIKTADILRRLTIGMINEYQAKKEILDLFNVSGSYSDGYKKGVKDTKEEAILQIRRIDSDL